jgi:hypothetical protein
MKAIKTKWVGPTARRGNRVIASDLDGNRASFNPDVVTALETGDYHDAAARALCLKMGWCGTLVRGGLENGYVYVWTGDHTVTVKAEDMNRHGGRIHQKGVEEGI